MINVKRLFRWKARGKKTGRGYSFLTGGEKQSQPGNRKKAKEDAATKI